MDRTVLQKHQIERALLQENKDVSAGRGLESRNGSRRGGESKLPVTLPSYQLIASDAQDMLPSQEGGTWKSLHCGRVPTEASSCQTPETSEFFDREVEDIFSSIDFDISTNVRPLADGRGLTSSAALSDASQHLEIKTNVFDDDELFTDSVEDDLLIAVTDQFERSSNLHSSQDQRSISHSRTETNEPSTSLNFNDTTSSSVEQPESHQTGHSSEIKRPVGQRTLRGAVNSNEDSTDLPRPIVRPHFPSQVRDRSPIIGLSSYTVLRTCFRIGEAINAGCHAGRHGKDVLIELYARVLSSERYDEKQYFTFCDLFHAKPPYMQGTYTAAIYRSSELFNFDSGRFLVDDKRMCRSIGKMKRDGYRWEFVVLNIWEAMWEDVKWVEGIVNA